MPRFLNRQRIVLYALALLALFGARELRMADPPLVASLRALTFDAYQRLKPRQPLGQALRIVDIDEASIGELGQWPWPRTQIARMVTRLTELGAAAIAFDIVFSEPDRTGPAGFLAELRQRDEKMGDAVAPLIAGLEDNDIVLVRALESIPTALGFFNDSNSALGLPEPKAGFASIGPDPRDILPPIAASVMSLKPFRDASDGSGTISLGDNLDGVVRTVPMFVAAQGGRKYPSLALETLRLVQGASTYILKTSEAGGEFRVGELAMTDFKLGQFEVPVTRKGELIVYYAHNDPSLYLSARDLLTKSDTELAPLVEGHIVFFGASASGLRDIRITPLGESVPGVFVHQQIVDQILQGAWLARPDWAEGAELAAMFISTALLVGILPFAGAVISGLIGLACALALVGGSWYAFSTHGLLLDPVFPVMAASIIFLMATIFVFAVTEREKRFVRGAFQRYLAPDLLRKLESHPDSLKLGGEMRQMTLMFMDVRGFTPISERLTPEELIAFLNRLLTPLSDAIQHREGAIDKYIGDSIMAFWNAPLDVPEHERKAARAALEMVTIVDRLNAEDAFGFHRPELGLGDVQVGIGVNSGMGCVGNMGSDTRFNYSVVGDTVNVAARIESSCKAVGWPVLLSETTAGACAGFAMLEAGSIALKGKSAPATLFALIGDETLAATAEWKQLAECHARFVADRADPARAGDLSALTSACLAAAPPELAGKLSGFYERQAAAALVSAAEE